MIRHGSILFLFLSWVLVDAAAHADYLSLCNQIEQSGEIRSLGRAYLGNEEVFLISSQYQPEQGNCDSVEMSIPNGAIRWGSLVDGTLDSTTDRLILQGNFNEPRALVSEIIFNEPPAPLTYLPLSENILPVALVDSFGQESRASFADNKLLCTEGNQVAGVVLHTDEIWPNANDQSLIITGQGSGKFEVAVSDERRTVAQAPLVLGSMEFTRQNTSQTFHFELPADSHWQSLTLVCPLTQAEISLEQIYIEPVLPEPVEQRSAWFWHPRHWLQNADWLLEVAEEQSLSEIYITVPTSNAGDVINPSELAEFIRSASQKNIRIWAVIGERHDVLPENLSLTITRVNAYQDFNQEHPDTRLAGVQLDIEPYLLPGFTLNQAHWRERYLQTITAVLDEVEQSLPVDVVMPVWWGSHPDWGRLLFDNLTLPGLSITVMNYRTDPERIKRGATPFFVWAEENQIPVRMALEAGPLPNETRLYFSSTPDEGELWLIDVGEQSVLLLLDQAYDGLNGSPYTLQRQDTFSADNLTFANNLDQLAGIAGLLEAEWSAWDSFRGLAIHGLDSIYAEALE